MWMIALILLIFSVYAPFMGYRLLRMAGDEKVYISQALEMERHGRWFLQTLQDEPNYYKGPLHYILLRIGFLLFGRSPWAVLYMNLVLVTLGALALGAIVRRRLPEWRGGDVWIGAAFALCVGIYCHTWASQMEVELASLFAISYYLLDGMDELSPGYAYWLVAGLIGWVKSPLHAVFAGATAILYWILRGQIFRRLLNPRAWLAAILGVAFCGAGYLPAYLWDRRNFINAYFIRETLEKGSSGQSWTVSIYSSFGFYLLIWLVPALVAYAHLVFGFYSLIRESRLRRLLVLAASGFAPSVAFFIWHPYHFENYDLPVIGAIWLLIATVWGSLAVRRVHKTGNWTDVIWTRLYAVALGLTAVALLAFPVGVSILAWRFSPLPKWWPGWLVPLIWLTSLVTITGLLRFGAVGTGKRPLWLALSSGVWLWGLGALLAVLGERELVDLNQYLRDASFRGETVSLGYYNLNRNIWSEWGYLNFWVDHEVHGLHTPAALRSAIQDGETILVPAKDNGAQDFREFISREMPEAEPRLRYIPWKRWRTQGRSESGKSLWQQAWDEKSLAPLEVDYYIVETHSG